MVDFVANFNLENNEIESDFELEQTQFDAILEINASPQKVSQLENDLHFQTKDEVDSTIEAESEIINTRIDNEVERLEEEISQSVTTVEGSALIDVSRDEQTVTISSKTFVFEQGIASNIWEIQHNLNKYPSVALVDSAGTQFIAQIEYNDKNTCTIYINGATKGKAYLN